jgi:hypothetical protein
VGDDALVVEIGREEVDPIDDDLAAISSRAVLARAVEHVVDEERRSGRA